MRVKVIPTQKATNFNKELEVNGLEHCLWISPVENKPLVAPIVWDACMYSEGDSIVIEGGVGAGGFGEIKVKIPKENVKDYYDIYMEGFTKRELPNVLNILINKGYDYEIEN